MWLGPHSACSSSSCVNPHPNKISESVVVSSRVKMITCHCGAEATFFRFHYEFEKIMHGVLSIGCTVTYKSTSDGSPGFFLLDLNLAFISHFGEYEHLYVSCLV
jgi:hypothetical protein